MVFKRPCRRCKGDDKKHCKHKLSWACDFVLGGTRYRIALRGCQNKRQAEIAEAKIKAKVLNGEYGQQPKTMLLKEFVEKVFLPWSKQEKRSWRNDVSRSKPILLFFKTKKLHEVSRFDVERYRKYRTSCKNHRDKLYEPASLDREIQRLSRIFSLAIERSQIKSNPCSGVKLLNPNNLQTRYLSYAAEAQLLKVLSQSRNKNLLDIFTVALATGMRKREVLGLRRNQVDRLRNVIELSAAQTKSNRTRAIPISSALRPTLVRLCANAGESGLLFVNPKTDKQYDDIKRAWCRALRVAGLEHITFHAATRHSFGTRAVDGGASISAVQAVMGHANVQTTMRYAHGTDEGKRRAVEAVTAPNVPAHGAPVAHNKKATA